MDEEDSGFWNVGMDFVHFWLGLMGSGLGLMYWIGWQNSGRIWYWGVGLVFLSVGSTQIALSGMLEEKE